MLLTFSNCILKRGSLFTRKIISFKCNFTYCTYHVKKQPLILQAKYFSTDQSADKNSNRELIYTGNMNSKIFHLKLLSLTSSIASIFLQPILYMNMEEENSATTLAMVFAFFNLIAITSPLMVHAIAKRYVLELYYDPKEEEYIAQIYSFFLKKYEVKFKPKDVTLPQTRFTDTFTSCYAKKHPLLFQPTLFTNILHYKAIMGYEEKIELEVEKLKLPRPINRRPVIESATNSQLESVENNQLEETKNKAKI